MKAEGFQKLFIVNFHQNLKKDNILNLLRCFCAQQIPYNLETQVN